MPKGVYRHKPHTSEHNAKIGIAVKGNIPWNKNKRGLQVAWNKNLTKETDKRIALISEKMLGSQNALGHHFNPTPEQRINISERLLENKNAFGYIWTPEQRAKMNHSGKNNPNWRDGLSCEPYSIDFNDDLRESIRQRDNYQCQECGILESKLIGIFKKLDVHHINYCKKNNNSDNLISLCKSCHMQTGFNREDWVNYFNERIIGVI